VSCNDQAIILRVLRDLTSIISQFEFCQSSNAKYAVVSGFPLVFANMSSFQGQPPNLDVSYDIDFLYFPPYESSTTIMFDSCTHRSPATVAEKRGKRLGLDVSDAQLANKDPARTANSIKAPMVDDISSRPGAPRASPLKQLWSRLRHAVTRTFSKRSDVADIEDSRGREQGSRATHRMSTPLLITGTSSVRDPNVTRPNSPNQHIR
jgi:hypothetical protein